MNWLFIFIGMLALLAVVVAFYIVVVELPKTQKRARERLRRKYFYEFLKWEGKK